MIKQFYFKRFSLKLVDSLNVKQFYLTLLGATTPGQSGSGSNGNEWVIYIP